MLLLTKLNICPLLATQIWQRHNSPKLLKNSRENLVQKRWIENSDKFRRMLSAGGPIALAAMANAQRDKERPLETHAIASPNRSGIGMPKYASPEKWLAHQVVTSRETVWVMEAFLLTKLNAAASGPSGT